MKIVVTGASGFIGRSLMQYFTQAGFQAVGVSRRHSPGLLQVTSYESTPVGDVLVHLAEDSDRRYAQTNAPQYEQHTFATLASLLDKGFSRVVYASSAVLYGDQGVVPRKVSDPVCEVDAYTRLKLASERMVLAHGGAVARLTNLYGPGMAEGNVLSTILKQIPNDGPVRVFDATPVRDFLWIDDAARALGLMATHWVAGIFNVGSEQGVSIRELASMVLKAAGQGERPIESAHSDNRYSSLVVDAALTKKTFGWLPTVSLVEGLTTLVKMNLSKNE